MSRNTSALWKAQSSLRGGKDLDFELSAVICPACPNTYDDAQECGIDGGATDNSMIWQCPKCGYRLSVFVTWYERPRDE